MPNTSPIRVLIVDDHAMIRRGLAAYLLGRANLTVVGEASDGQEALDVIRTAARCRTARHPDASSERDRGRRASTGDILGSRLAIMLTSFQESDLMQAALAAGASGYLLKDVAEENLVAAIRLAHAGHTLVPPAYPLRQRHRPSKIISPGTKFARFWR